MTARARSDATRADVLTGRPPASSRHDWLNGLGLRLALYLSLPAFLLVWQLVSASGRVNRILTPAPTDVFAAIVRAIRDGTLLLDVGWSVSRVIVGYAIGAVLGIVTGLITARFKLFDNLLSPALQTL